jgi:hypothetical protein
MSAALRAPLFLLANWPAGQEAALAAGATEFWFRFVTAGFYGAMTEAFSRLRTPRSTWAALLVVPGIAHVMEFLVHTWRGTPIIGPAIAASIALTIVSTSFNLFAMRRGALLSGDGCRPLREDLREIPRLVMMCVGVLLRLRP